MITKKYSAFLLSLVLIANAAGILSGCGKKEDKPEVSDTVTSAEAEKHEHESDITRTEAGAPQFTVDDIFKKQVTAVFDSYVKLKEAFVDSNADKAKKEAKNSLSELGNVDMKLVTEQAHTDWMVYQNELKSSLDKIATENDLEKQREAFSKLSYSMYKTIKAYGLSGTTAYYEFCPMAFNDKGAYWLSNEDKIRNPYFGDKMLTCGSVEETLR